VDFILNLKNYEIINAVTAIKELIKIKDMETKTKWNFIKNLNNLQRIVDDFSKLEIEMVNEFALKDESGNIRIYEEDEGNFRKGDPKFAPVKHKEFITKRDELLQCESEIDIHKIKLDDLPKIEDGTALLLCSFLIDDSE
jgi:hypothetical protein